MEIFRLMQRILTKDNSVFVLFMFEILTNRYLTMSLILTQVEIFNLIVILYFLDILF